MRFVDPELGAGQLALIATPHRDGLHTMMVVATAGWSVGFHLTSGQLHRLTNGLAGRGRRHAIRPLSVDGDHVYVAGTPERLTVEYRDQLVTIPAGPRRGLSKALRAFEQNPPLSAG